MLSLPPCPKCGSKAVIHLGGTQTLVHVPIQTDDNGNFMMSNQVNKSINNYTCKKCGENYHD